MPTQPQHPDLASIIIDLSRRLTALEHAGPETITITDPTGADRVILGLLPSGNYGIRILNANGTIAFEEFGT